MTWAVPSGTFLPVSARQADGDAVRSIPFQLRMTPVECAALDEIADANGLTKSAMVRRLILIEQAAVQRKRARRRQ